MSGSPARCPSSRGVQAGGVLRRYSGRKGLEALRVDPGHLLGAPLIQAVGTAMILHAQAHAYSGYFDPAGLDRGDSSLIRSIVPRRDIVAVIESVFGNTIDQFVQQQAGEAPPPPFLDRAVPALPAYA
jgi:hypothetical protein